MDSFRPTYAEIDLRKLQRNIHSIKKSLSRRTKFMAIVKADAYGHGALEVASAAEGAQVDYLGVASLGEALQLRAGSIRCPILILSESSHSYLERLIDANITQTVYTFQLAKVLSDKAKKWGKSVKLHIKIDTGMSRVGASPKEAVALIKKITELPNVFIEGIFTQLAKADDKSSNLTIEQLKKFFLVVNAIKSDGINIPLIHAANSAAMLNYPETHLDMVRIGICMYGLEPFENSQICINLEPVLTFRTSVCYIKEVPADTPISYGATYFTRNDTQIATLPVGYADGVPRSLSNRGAVLINKEKFPIVGNVTMDMIMVDVNDARIKIGDNAVIIGNQGKEKITATEVARLDDTIHYEILCGIGKRVPRVYLT